VSENANGLQVQERSDVMNEKETKDRMEYE